MLRTPSLALLACLALVPALARCAGCSEECTGLRWGSETCPCQTDQDCTTVGAVLLCTNGACAPGDPPDVHGDDPCDDDDDCGTGSACAADATCQPSPACQRIELGELATRALDGADTVISSATVAPSDVDGAPQADCGVTVDVEEPAMSTTGFFARGGALTATGCTGQWFAAHRAGFLVCGGASVALSAPGVTTCIGAACDVAGCREIGGNMGVCP